MAPNPNDFLGYDSLAPYRVFEILAEVAESLTPAQHSQLDTAIRFARTMDRSGFDLLLPTDGGTKERREVIEKLRLAMSRSGDSNEVRKSSENIINPFRFAEALGGLLLQSGQIATKSLEPSPIDFLLIGWDVGAQEVESLAQLLHERATHARVARTTVTFNNTSQEITLVLVRADAERFATFGAWWRTQRLPGWELFRAYGTGDPWGRGGIVLFLHPTHDPDAPADTPHPATFKVLPPEQVAYQRLNRLLEIAPQLLSIPKERPCLIAMVAQGTDIQTIAFGQLAYSTVIPAAVQGGALHFLEIAAPADGLNKLPNRLLEARPLVGYHLALRRTIERDITDFRLNQIQQTLNELRLEELEIQALRQPRPRLLRFTQAQLPAFADFLRQQAKSYLTPDRNAPPTPTIDDPMREPLRDKLYYAFSANDDASDGYHFVWIPHALVDVITAEILSVWQLSDEPPMVMNLDPYYSRFYATDQEARCFVFVPEGLCLYPYLHALEEDRMAEFLATMVAEWSQGRERAPMRPIYLFEPNHDSNLQDALRLTVLDLEKFVPLYTQVPWLNDCITVLESAPYTDARDLITEAARHERLARVALQSQEQYNQRAEAFNRAATTLTEQVTNHTTDLTNTLAGELEDLTEQIEETFKNIDTLRSEVERLRRLKSGIEMIGKMQQGLAKTLEADLKSSDDEITRFEEEVKNAVAHADKTDKQVGALLTSEIAAQAEIMERLLAVFRGSPPRRPSR